MFRRCFLHLLLVFSVQVPASADDADAAIIALPGSLPLILTVPHDGTAPIGNVYLRTKGAIVRDIGTRELAEKVAARMEERLGRRPYLVIAKFSRKYLDANRSESEAMESQDAMPSYRAYHGKIASYVAEVKARYPHGSLLVDIHGQGAEPNVTFRGTRSGLTASALLKRFGIDALQDGQSIIGVLARKGYEVDPLPGAATLDEDRRFSGGYTVHRYGSHNPEGIDAIQLEFGRAQRDNPALAEDLADALIAFMSRYDLL